MYLYNFILQRATGITHAVHGSFAGTKLQEILLAKGKGLELVRPDPNTGKVHTLLQTEVFGVVRSLMSFRLTGGSKGRLDSSSPFFSCSVVRSEAPTRSQTHASYRDGFKASIVLLGYKCEVMCAPL